MNNFHNNQIVIEMYYSAEYNSIKNIFICRKIIRIRCFPFKFNITFLYIINQLPCSGQWSVGKPHLPQLPYMVFHCTPYNYIMILIQTLSSILWIVLYQIVDEMTFCAAATYSGCSILIHICEVLYRAY